MQISKLPKRKIEKRTRPRHTLRKRILLSVLCGIIIFAVVFLTLYSPHRQSSDKYVDTLTDSLPLLTKEKVLASHSHGKTRTTPAVSKIKNHHISKSDSAPKLNTNKLRCYSQSLGCFDVRKIVKKGVAKIEADKISCLHHCSERSLQYYLTSGSKCWCASDANFIVDIQSWRECRPCDKDNHCDAEFELFRILEHCHNGYSSEILHKYSVGCVRSLPKDVNKQKGITTASTTSLIECIATCEKAGHPLAVKKMTGQRCLCSNVKALFSNASDLQKSLSECEANGQETAYEIYRTFVDDTFCSHRVLLQDKEAPVIALASPPGSGNTWMRYMIEVATGIFTGSAYQDRRLSRGGFLGELTRYDSGRTIVVKDHFMKEKHRYYYEAILLLRSPYNALLADYQRKKAGHIGVAEQFNLTEFRQYMTRTPQEWFRRIESGFSHTIAEQIVVLYEDLQRDPVREMRRVINFLPKHIVEKHIPDIEHRLLCLVLDHAGSFKRPSYDLKYELFDKNAVKAVRPQVSKLNRLLAARGLRKLPEFYSAP